VDVVLGIQWGDEGKGRVVDLYAESYDVVARFGGGDNAGHTLRVADRTVALRIVPSGALQPNCTLFIGGGTVVSLEGLLGELAALRELGVADERVLVSDRAHVVLPYHVAVDGAAERARGSRAIGTTGRGIGPAYTDKTARLGLTVGDLRDPAVVRERIRSAYAIHAARLPADLRDALAPEAEIVARVLDAAERLQPHVVDGVEYLHGVLERGGRVLAEGAQGTLLDLGYGTYPYVTSSHTVAGGACTGLGIGPSAVRRVIGIAKAYCTRVGAGPFPSELPDERGALLRNRGGEFGTVTGRPRRCGWFDGVAARYARRLNGLDAIVLTKLDVLSGIPSPEIVTAYRIGAHDVPFSACADERLEVVTERCEGWAEELCAARAFTDLPPAARRYVRRLSEILGVPVEAVSVGPERTQVIRDLRPSGEDASTR